MKLWRASYAITSQYGETGRDEMPGTRVLTEDFYMAESEDVRRHIISRGGWPIEIAERRRPRFTFLDTKSVAWQLQMLRALRFQTVHTSAGTALEQIIEDEQDPERRVAALPARAVLKGGGTFATALKAMQLFDSATQAIITAGERTADMKGVIAYAITHIEEAQKRNRIIKTWLGWLAFDIFSLISSTISAQVVYIPYLRSSGMTSQDPKAIERFTQALNFASLINGTLTVGTFALVAFAMVLAFAYWRNRHLSDHWSARIIRRIPAIGAYLRAMSMADTSHTLARLARSAVPLDEAISIVQDTAVSPEIRSYWQGARHRIRSGMKPQRALAAEPLSRVEQSQIGTYETITQLAEVMDSIGEERELEAKAAQRRIVQIGIAFLLVVIAAVFGMAMYLMTLQNEGMLESINSLRR